VSGIIYRPLAEADLDAVTALEAASFSRPWSRDDFADTLIKPYYLYYVAEENGCVTATAGLIISIDEADISNVAVAQSRRRRGIAAGLLTALMEAGRKRGVSGFTLEVRSKNTAAIRLYEKLGFKQEGVRKHFYRDPDDDAMIYWMHDK